jgi:hypothetical protein
VIVLAARAMRDQKRRGEEEWMRRGCEAVRRK